MQLTGLVKEIVPVVREVAGEGNDKLEKVLTDVEKVNEAVATAPDPVSAVEKGWKASEPFNPYYGYGAAALALFRLWQKKKESDIIENKYSAAKVGMDKFRNANPDKATELYNDVGEARKAKKIV
jgi:hypothetical protein